MDSFAFLTFRPKKPGNRPARSLPHICIMTLVVLAGMSVSGKDCRETVTIDGREFTVPERWCGHRLDSSEVADKTRLVELPEKLTYENYRIYVLAETGTAFVKMAAAAEKDGLLLIVDSGYRSASYQTEIIKRRLADGEEPETILSFVAPPGYSEHETGRAVDLVPSDASFAETPAYRWMKANAAGFGFYESYPESTADSIPWEPSHWLYRTLEATR